MEPAGQIRDEETAVLTIVYNEVEANLIRAILEEAGIDCLLVTQVPHSVYPLTINGLGETKIKVLTSRLEEAKAVLAESREQDPIAESGGDMPE